MQFFPIQRFSLKTITPPQSMDGLLRPLRRPILAQHNLQSLHYDSLHRTPPLRSLNLHLLHQSIRQIKRRFHKSNKSAITAIVKGKSRSTFMNTPKKQQNPAPIPENSMPASI